MIEQVGQTVKDECESEFIHSSDTSALLLRQMMLQADQWKLKLSADVQQLENRALIQLIRDFEKMESNLSSTKNFNAQKLTPIQDEGKSIKSVKGTIVNSLWSSHLWFTHADELQTQKSDE